MLFDSWCKGGMKGEISIHIKTSSPLSLFFSLFAISRFRAETGLRNKYQEWTSFFEKHTCFFRVVGSYIYIEREIEREKVNVLTHLRAKCGTPGGNKAKGQETNATRARGSRVSKKFLDQWALHLFPAGVSPSETSLIFKVQASLSLSLSIFHIFIHYINTFRFFKSKFLHLYHIRSFAVRSYTLSRMNYHSIKN